METQEEKSQPRQTEAPSPRTAIGAVTPRRTDVDAVVVWTYRREGKLLRSVLVLNPRA